MPKSNNNTTSKKKLAKKETWYETYRNLNTWRKFPVSDAFIEKLCQEMLEHFENPKSICILKFLTDRGIRSKLFYGWIKKHPNLDEVYHFVKDKIGSRREKLAIHREENCDPKTLHYTMRHYNPYWRKSFTEESDLKLKLGEKNNEETKIVVIEKFPEIKSENRDKDKT